jgi:hypothetical protein
MTSLAIQPIRISTPDQRAQVLAEAVVSAYIDEIARPGRARRLQNAVRRPITRLTAAARPLSEDGDPST